MSADGGALPKMLPPFRMGLGGRLGNGRQWWTWVSVRDVVGAIQHVLNHDDDLRAGQYRRPESGNQC